MKKLFFIASLFLVACSSALKTGVESAGQETVISRIDGMSSRPDWLKEQEPFVILNNQVYALGQVSIPGDHRVEAAYKISENNGKSLISSAIEQKLEFIFQNAEEGTSMDSTQVRFIGAEASKLTANSIRVSKRYWEKVTIIQENGQPTVRYKVFSLIQMPESDFKTAIIDAVRKSQGKVGLSADFAKKVDQHWDQFVNADVARVPATKPENE